MYVTINEDKCIGCNACIRVCPVHEANRAVASSGKNHSIISINHDMCISCGECVKSCEHGARDFVDDAERFFHDIKSGKKITVVVAPALRLTEPDSDAMLAHLREIGVNLIYDVSFGADICTYMHIKAIKENKVDKVMSQPCAALVEYILKHRHNMISMLSPVHSPISCTAAYLRKYAGISGDIACISPCIAKKFEFEETGLIQYNVTFKRFVEIMKRDFTYDKTKKFKFDNVPAYCGKIYPKPGGLKDCLLNVMPNLDVRNSEGVSHVYGELDYYAAADKNDRPDVYDILSCSHGCISGPGTNFDESRLFSYMKKAESLEASSFHERRKQKAFNVDKQFKWFEKHLKLEDFIRNYTPKQTNNQPASELAINSAYAKLMKKTHSEKHFDCGACGYKSCEEMASAIAKGINFPENCHQFTVKKIELEQEHANEASVVIQSQNEQIISTINNITDDIEKICSDANGINELCLNNSGEMNNINEIINILNDKCVDIHSAVNGIIDVNKQYKEISESIKNITDQTHILSMNASVEAARAGEAGKSFSIVAQEIRTLAANTKNATSTIDESEKLVNIETAKVLEIAKEIEKVANNLSGAISHVSGNIDNTISSGQIIRGTAEDIRTAADRLRR
ncbi:MAG: 4Fe-4S binding protein [Oscillospiraceae bacterium]|nr:4Fe-4S binding protein [Oscillospiraceae bacterium]